MSSFNASLEEDDEKIEVSEAFFCSYRNINIITFVKKRSIDSGTDRWPMRFPQNFSEQTVFVKNRDRYGNDM